MDLTCITHGRISGAAPAGLLAHIAEHLVEYGLPVDLAGERLSVVYNVGDAVMTVGATGVEITIRAVNETQLFQLREGAFFLLDQVFPDGAARITWTGSPTAKRHPPNFHLANVVSTARIGANFLRVELACDRIEHLSQGGMHFTLVLPPEGRTPVWPMVNEKGRTEWPGGEDALHRAAYTFVTLDPATGRLTFDLYLHQGSLTSDWALSARPGTAVGVMGPGGGDFPPGDRIILAGDETALPAIRRILEHSAPERTGEILIETADPGDCLLTSVPDGMRLTWLSRGNGPSLGEALARMTLPHGTGEIFVWVAAEQEVVRAAKARFRKDFTIDRRHCYFSAYWARTAVQAYSKS